MDIREYDNDEELMEHEDNSGLIAMLVSIREFAKSNNEHKTEQLINTIMVEIGEMNC